MSGLAPRFPPDLGVFLILPDALRQGLVPSIGKYLDKYGLYPAAVTSEILTEQHTKVLYDGLPRSKYSATGRVHGPEMTRRLLALDNSLAVLVATDDGGAGHGDVSRLLHDVKGNSSFRQRRPGSLRELSASADRCMSLIHTPDDAVEAARDAALFFPAVNADRRRGPRTVDWDLVHACRAWHPPDPDCSRYSIAVRTMLRCVALLLAEMDLPFERKHYAALWSAYDVCRGWLSTPPATDSAAEHQRFTDVCGRLAALLAVPLTRDLSRRGARFPAIQQLIALHLRPEEYDHQRGLRVLDVLAAARLRLTDYESHHLLTLFTFLRD